MLRKSLMGAGFGPPEFVGATSANKAFALSFSGITDLQKGDVVVVLLSQTSFQPVITSSGWTTIYTGDDNDNDGDVAHQMAYKTMGSSVDTGVNATCAGSNGIDALTATAFRNVDATGIQVSALTAEGNESFTALAGPLVSAVADSVFVVLTCIDGEQSTVITPPTGYTLAAEDGDGSGSNAQLYKLEVSSPDEASALSTVWEHESTMLSALIALPPR